MKLSSKIFVAGASGMAGSAIIITLIKMGYTDIVGSYHSRKQNKTFISSGALRFVKADLTNQQEAKELFMNIRPEYIFMAAAKVGGIYANNAYPAEFIYQNLMMEANVINAAYQFGVQRLLFLGSSCIYPKFAKQPIKEDSLLTGILEATNEPYAVAKIAGIKLCESFNRQYGTDYRSVMPTNLYGPGDSFHLENSHVIPALLRKFHLGKCLEQNDLVSVRADLNARPIKRVDGTASTDVILQTLAEYGVIISPKSSPNKSFTQNTSQIIVKVWGSGQPKREFLHVDDMANACVYVMNLPEDILKKQTQAMLSHINIGTGVDCTIKELAETIARVTGFHGRIGFDTGKPDGTPRKLLDVSRLKSLGWQADIELEYGLKNAYEWYKQTLSK